MKHLRVVRSMPKNRHLQNVVGTEHIKDAAEQAIAAQAEGGATLAFKNVAVAGQSNIVADAATDTLNIAAGANVTITTNASTDTITIAATDTNTDTNTFRPVTAGGNTLGASETLAFTAGSNVTISESAGAVTIAAASASPGGSDTQIQYNNGGSLGGISSFTYDDTSSSEKFIISASSDQDLVRITQTGSGNALVVEDAANPDSTAFKISSSGKVGIGVDPDSNALKVNGNVATQGGQITATRFLGNIGGTESGPRFTYDGDTDTGIFFPAADNTAITTGGSERIRVGSAGQIGIAGANYGNAGEVLTSGGASGAVSWAAAGGGGGLPIHYIDEDNPPTFTNSASYNSIGGTQGFSIVPGVPQGSSIAGGNFTSTSAFLWAFTWPATDHYIDQIKFRIFSASQAGSQSSFRMAFYKADSNGWPGARTGDQLTFTPTSTGSHFLTTTLASGSGIGPFNRGDLVWAGFVGPGGVNYGGTIGTVRFYGQQTNQFGIAGMAQSSTGPNPGYSYLFPYRLYVNSGGVTGFPSDLRDGSTWDSITSGNPTTRTIYPAGVTLGSSSYYPFIQVVMRSTA